MKPAQCRRFRGVTWWPMDVFGAPSGALCSTRAVSECRTCELIERRDAGEAPPWDMIARTNGWDIVHAFGTTVEGWIVVVARRHITAVAALTDEEARELGPLIRRVSLALHETVHCPKTYVAEFAEHPQHPHVHVHVIARAEDLPADQRGPAIFSQLGVTAERCVPEARMDEIAAEIRLHLDG